MLFWLLNVTELQYLSVQSLVATVCLGFKDLFMLGRILESDIRKCKQRNKEKVQDQDKVVCSLISKVQLIGQIRLYVQVVVVAVGLHNFYHTSDNIDLRANVLAEDG